MHLECDSPTGMTRHASKRLVEIDRYLDVIIVAWALSEVNFAKAVIQTSLSLSHSTRVASPSSVSLAVVHFDTDAIIRLFHGMNRQIFITFIQNHI